MQYEKPFTYRWSPVTPGITALEYAQRRSRLAAKLPKNGIAIIAASDVKYRSGAVFYDFHQDSDFFYLTGFNEPEAVAVIGDLFVCDMVGVSLIALGKSSEDDDHTFHLFVRPKDAKAEQWDGIRSGTQAALDVFNADETGDVSKLSSLLSPFIADSSKVYTDIASESKTKSWYSRFARNDSPKAEGFSKLLESKGKFPLKDIIYELRNIKSDSEIANMRKAGQVSGRVFTDAMRQVWAKETDLAAYLDYGFRTNGCDTSAYVPVVAGGQNASVIHYVQNNHLLRNDQLVLVDAGGEYGGYITDITRTWPVSGKFSPAQRDLYNAVLATQRRCVSFCRANASLSLDSLHDMAELDLKDQLKQIGFNMSGKAIDTLFPHHISHYIGLDVHDTPGQSRKAHLKARQCVTVEPGIYVPDTDNFPVHFRGMGIRIEDSVCVEEEHPLVLTTEAVKEVEDIEALRS
ncbi:aminopeptidase [Lecanora helva]